MKLSVIIPTLNEEKYLPHILNCLKNQTFRDFEVVVADNYSTDRTVSIAKSFGARVAEGGLPSRARNLGAYSAKNECLLFLDADVVIDNDFLEKNFSEFVRKNLDAGTTYVTPVSNRLLDKIIHRDYWNMIYFIMQYFNPHAAGFCIFCKKDYYNKVGGFDETITLGEDHAFVMHAKRFRILHGPKVRVNVRRLDKEGRIKFIIKMFYAFIYRTFIGEIRSNKINYEFGH
jgi:glycosyltransferase involved in cell wall biosynthesis